MVGIEFHRLTARLTAFAVFRTLAIFLLIVAAQVLTRGQPLIALTLIVIAMDIMIVGVTMFSEFNIAKLDRKLWIDHLTVRIFIEDFWKTKNIEGQHIDINELFRSSTRKAAEDFKLG